MHHKLGEVVWTNNCDLNSSLKVLGKFCDESWLKAYNFARLALIS